MINIESKLNFAEMLIHFKVEVLIQKTLPSAYGAICTSIPSRK